MPCFPRLLFSLSLSLLQFFLSTSPHVKPSVVIGPPVVFAPDGIMHPKLSGGLAVGGEVTASELSEFVLTYNCKHNGTGLVTVQVGKQKENKQASK